MKRTIVFMIILFALLLSACGRADPALTAKDAGKTVQVKVGQTIAITLDGNPSTGYTWEAENKDLKTLKLAGEPEFKSSNTDKNVVGAGGTLTLRFQAVAAGQETLTLVYHRPWETDVKPLQTYTVTVVVQ